MTESAANKPPLVLMLAHSYYPDDPRIRREAEALVAAGIRVRAVSLSKDGRIRRWECGGVEVYETGMVKKRAGLATYAVEYMKTLRACRAEVVRSLAEDPPSLVQIHTLPDFLVWAARPARRTGVPVLLDLHESMPDFFGSKYERGDGRRSMPFRVLESLERHCARQADGLVTVNDEIADAFETRLGRRPTVVMNTVDEALFSWRRKQIEWPAGPKVLGYHGTITPIYGLDLLVRALPAVIAAHPGTTVEIYGDGPSRVELEALAEEMGVGVAVNFRGRVPLAEMSERLRSIHVGVVPTRKDSFLDMSLATKLLEYVYLGIPVVTSNLNAAVRTLGESGTVTFFEGNDPASLATQLISVLGAEPAQLQQGVLAAKAVYDGIAWPIMAARYVELVKQLVGEHSK